MISKGQKINDRYQIVKTIGEGGMANVYLAYDVILERNVAVKVLRGDLSSDEKFVRRFQREALSASSLTHANVVEVYDVGEDNGLYYIVMEFIEGKHLKQLIKRRGNLTINEVMDIMLQITDGMAAAHDSYIIHRDIKPQNIMILENGIVKITDFGIAMALNGTQLTQTNSVMGSVHYLPPEQASGKGSTIQSDIYSMGILMYELLTSKLPYKGDNPVEIALKHLKDPLPSIRKEIPDLPQSIENIILRSAAKNPKNRYLDAREMFEDIKTCLDESRADEEAYIYEFPEGDDTVGKSKPKVDIDDTEEIEVKPKKRKAGDTKPIAKKIEPKDLKKKENKTLLILGAIFTGLVLITTCVIIFLPRLTDSREIVIPNVAGMEVGEAEGLLRKNGFRINITYRYVASEQVEEGNVVKTDPAIGRTVKKGTTVTLYLSTGEGIYEMENLVGRNYIEVKAVLERMYNLFVVIEEVEVDNANDHEPNIILKQEPAVGTMLGAGDTVTLFIADLTATYPDFTTDRYSLQDIQAFANKYNLNLMPIYQERSGVEPGTIFNQEPRPGAAIVNGMTLRIFIAEDPDDH